MAKTKQTKPMVRCEWPKGELDIEYHDREWGAPVHDETTLFEFLILEGAQAGLSWTTILKKRAGYRRAFAEFDVAKVARFTPRRIEILLDNPAIVRNRLKVNSTVTNAQAFLKVQEEFGTFDEFIWQFVEGRAIQNRRRSCADIPAKTAESDVMSKELKRRGFKFVGSTICYAFMQGVGMVNDHTLQCYRYQEIKRLAA